MRQLHLLAQMVEALHSQTAAAQLGLAAPLKAVLRTRKGLAPDKWQQVQKRL
jgi:hypothetical protein